MPFAATWVNLETIILSKLDSERQTSQDIRSLDYIWNLKKKKDTSDLICRTETDSLTLKNLWLPKGTGSGMGVMDWGLGVGICILRYIE